MTTEDQKQSTKKQYISKEAFENNKKVFHSIGKHLKEFQNEEGKTETPNSLIVFGISTNPNPSGGNGTEEVVFAGANGGNCALSWAIYKGMCENEDVAEMVINAAEIYKENKMKGGGEELREMLESLLSKH